ncbi:MAG: exosortase/archaeosortase family protein [Pirellulales bacterium]|nr:exosortase/archaeosortase family protein [Pirellulales bacterium]
MATTAKTRAISVDANELIKTGTPNLREESIVRAGSEASTDSPAPATGGGVAVSGISPLSTPISRTAFAICVCSLAGAFSWSYWPTLTQLVEAWDRIPDYSHGYLVVPIAIFFLWVKREQFPGFGPGLAWGGLVLMAAAFAMRFVGTQFFLGSVDAWSMVPWLAGTAWFLGGRRLFRWALPALVFLFFMIPLPYGMERWLSLPLQRIATSTSCWVLQCLGQPAIAEGNTIWIGSHTLEVEQACSGLRIFVGILALAYAYLLFMRRGWWERIFLLAAAIPISIAANAARIVATALLHEYVSGEAARRFTHDFAGWVMIPFAAGLFALALWYGRSLVREEEEVDMRSIIGLERLS